MFRQCGQAQRPLNLSYLPIMVQAQRQRTGEPTLRIIIRHDRADRLLVNWPGFAEQLAETLEQVITCILTYPRELGLLW